MFRCFIILLCHAFFCLAASSAAERWSLVSPQMNLQKNFELPPKITGPFLLDARIRLARLDGSAASIWFGDQLNFGFDGKGRSLFVEGSAAGGTKALAATADFIQPGKAFDFQAELTKDSLFIIRIDGREVYRIRAWDEAIDSITLRPHRNSLDLEKAQITGKFDLPTPGLTQSRPGIPLLTDGHSRALLHLHLVLDEPRTLRSVKLDAGAEPGVLSSLSLDLPGGWRPEARDGREITFTGESYLPPGAHRFSLTGSAAQGLSLLTRLHTLCVEMTFADGTTMRPQEAALPPLRPAYSIHKRGQFQCHTFRIPAITRAMDGSLLAVHDMRYLSGKDLQGHMDIGLSRSSDGGETWTDPMPIMDMGDFGGKPQQENGCSDPNILVDPKTGDVFVSAVWTHGKPGTHQWVGKGSEPGHDLHRSSQFLMVRSSDHGKTWSKPENWTSRLKDPAWHLFAPAPGNGIAMRDGTLVIPTQGRDAGGLPFSNLMFSKDHGKTWTVSNHARTDTTECAVAELAYGSLLLNMRDNRNRGDVSGTNGRAMAVTRDLGSTWAVHPADHSALPEPVCMASMISHTLPDGRHLLLFSNPRHKSARKNMTTQASFDQGNTWPRENQMMLDEAGGAYSSLVMIDDQTIGILYESSQADLVFQKIPLEEMVKEWKKR